MIEPKLINGTTIKTHVIGSVFIYVLFGGRKKGVLEAVHATHVVNSRGCDVMKNKPGARYGVNPRGEQGQEGASSSEQMRPLGGAPDGASAALLVLEVCTLITGRQEQPHLSEEAEK